MEIRDFKLQLMESSDIKATMVLHVNCVIVHAIILKMSKGHSLQLSTGMSFEPSFHKFIEDRVLTHYVKELASALPLEAL